MMHLVSIITPSFNKERYILETINSVINQTYINWELIIVDDLSTDGTSDLLNKIKSQDSRIKVIYNVVNNGANFCRNLGLKESTGEYVIFLDADDILVPNCIENRVNEISKESFDFCVFSMGVFNKTIGDNNMVWVPQTKKPLKDFLEHKLPWSILQPIWKKDFLMSIGAFDTQFNRLQDVELHTRALMQNNVNYKLVSSKPDCYYRIDEQRKNFNEFDFFKRLVESAVLFYSKLYKNASDVGLQNSLNGTLFKVYVQIILSLKSGNITKIEFISLENSLFYCHNDIAINGCKKIYFNLVKMYNLYCFRIPGVNWIFDRIICN